MEEHIEPEHDEVGNAIMDVRAKYRLTRKRYRKKYATSPRKSYQKMKGQERITRGEFQEMIDRQCGNCALCGKPLDLRPHGQRNWSKKPVLDHDHSTGKNRAVLHQNCNVAFGYLEENEEMLLNGAAYARKCLEARDNSNL